MAAAAAAAAGLARSSSSASALLSQRTASGLLPELALFVAQQEAEAAAGAGGVEETSAHLLLLCEATLPLRLQEWVVDPSLVTYQRWPNGKLRDLGSGASGHVFKASYNGETVAAKEMDLGKSAAVQEAFINEAMRLQALRHPNLVGFYGVCLAGSKGVVLLEYCEGRDLHSALGVVSAGGSQRLFSWYRRGRRVALEIAKALNYLHSKGIVHFDVKSSNVLLTSGGTAKLADVAFSRELIGEVLPDVPLIGTFPWIAPEVLLGGRECTQAVDIFSFGVVMWEIITGEAPKRGGMRMPLVPDECPQDASDPMMECLSESPAARPTAAQLLQRLGVMLERSGRGGPARTRSSVDGLPRRASLDVLGGNGGGGGRASFDVLGGAGGRGSVDVLGPQQSLSPISSPVDGDAALSSLSLSSRLPPISSPGSSDATSPPLSPGSG